MLEHQGSGIEPGRESPSLEPLRPLIAPGYLPVGDGRAAQSPAAIEYQPGGRSPLDGGHVTGS